MFPALSEAVPGAIYTASVPFPVVPEIVIFLAAVPVPETATVPPAVPVFTSVMSAVLRLTAVAPPYVAAYVTGPVFV